MKAIIFGATGMVGQGLLRECLQDERIEKIMLVGRRKSGVQHEKVEELVRDDLYTYDDVGDRFLGYDACFFCLGVSSAGMKEEAYRRITFDLTDAAARVLLQSNPDITFTYVSGAGTDSTEKGRIMWARVKGETENHLLGLGFKAAYMFRPGFIQPLHGIKSSTRMYRILYAILGPLYPVLKRLFPSHVTTTQNVGKAMIKVAAEGSEAWYFENRDINDLAGAP